MTSGAIEASEPDVELPARAAYKAYCDSRGVKPNWGKSGFQAKAQHWRRIAQAAINPVDPFGATGSSNVLSPDLSNFALSMNEVIPVLRRFLGIAVADESKFAGNLKHFHRIGFPSGLHTGRGRPAVFNREQFLQLTFALLFYKNGSTPARAIHLIEEVWPELHPLLDRMINAKASGDRLDAVVIMSSPGLTPDKPAPVRLQPIDAAIKKMKDNRIIAYELYHVDVALDALFDSLRATRPDIFP